MYLKCHHILLVTFKQLLQKQDFLCSEKEENKK